MSASDIPPPAVLRRTGLRTVTTNREPDQRVTIPPGAWVTWFGAELLDALERGRRHGEGRDS